MRNPLTVSLIWMPYPENKPKAAGYYYVQDRKLGIMPAYWSKNKRRFSGLRLVVGIPAVGVLWNILAYAELPEPYREEATT